MTGPTNDYDFFYIDKWEKHGIRWFPVGAVRCGDIDWDKAFSSEDDAQEAVKADAARRLPEAQRRAANLSLAAALGTEVNR